MERVPSLEESMKEKAKISKLTITKVIEKFILDEAKQGHQKSSITLSSKSISERESQTDERQDSIVLKVRSKKPEEGSCTSNPSIYCQFSLTIKETLVILLL